MKMPDSCQSLITAPTMDENVPDRWQVRHVPHEVGLHHVRAVVAGDLVVRLRVVVAEHDVVVRVAGDAHAVAGGPLVPAQRVVERELEAVAEAPVPRRLQRVEVVVADGHAPVDGAVSPVRPVEVRRQRFAPGERIRRQRRDSGSAAGRPRRSRAH